MKAYAFITILVLSIGAVSAFEDEELPTFKELKVDVVHEPEGCGGGRYTKPGDKVMIHYTGRLTDGTEFDTSIGGDPLKFVLGAGMVIEAWDIALEHMCPGEKRLMKVPAEYGYGAAGAPPKIPPNASLLFEIEFVDWYTD
eukprot:TRINITY_DN2021_c0_g1_i1.p3 TRINITY_DN2021_c0_g1~~TRINITY_DN2021_c0_g1_i1.p3  ORF type:complete len:141 (-),score=51.76 TRINITY_DN2021_c0_g1_i1:1548-1970(-)